MVGQDVSRGAELGPPVSVPGGALLGSEAHMLVGPGAGLFIGPFVGPDVRPDVGPEIGGIVSPLVGPKVGGCRG